MTKTVAAAKIVVSLAAIGLAYIAFLEHDALYNPVSRGGLRVIVMASISIYILHAAMHWIENLYLPKEDDYDRF